MDYGEKSLPDSINPNNFPAKLWRLVNDPLNKSIFWDKNGELVIIDENLFQRQILSPNTLGMDNPDKFKTTNFSSFVRQLNLYGFKKADPACRNATGYKPLFHRFYNSNFNRQHPELVASLRRLTAENKAKIQAGVDVRCRPPSQNQRYSSGDDGRDRNGKRGSSSPLSPTRQGPTPPRCPAKAQVMSAYNGTPVPPHFLMRGLGAAFSPMFAAKEGMPVSLGHQYAAVATSSNAVHFQQSLLARANHGNPHFATFNTSNAQHQPPNYSPVCQCYRPRFVASPMTGSGVPHGSFSPHSYYQASYPFHTLSHEDNNQNSKGLQDMKECDINLDMVFQIADEMMPLPSINNPVKVETPEKPHEAFAPSFSDHNIVLCDISTSTRTVKPRPVPTVTSVMSHAGLLAYKQQEESVVSVPEQVPENAIYEVTGDDEEDSEVVDVDVSDSVRDTSQST
ncbi:heat shock factor protein 5 isoform X2 [Plectropomus leopardus]|uniref:heat shock factor protein 5 isoform X2 n=1 Tax=Plectropomus leopardus TaxID=160734 RepID=UPI001C4D664F|nr:heat shock factor protein 5 isoform X2 [Plectropomus leopardus]